MQGSILDPKLNTVLRRVLPRDVYDRILYYEVCIRTEGTKKGKEFLARFPLTFFPPEYVTVVLTNTDIRIYPQRIELGGDVRSIS